MPAAQYVYDGLGYRGDLLWHGEPFEPQGEGSKVAEQIRTTACSKDGECLSEPFPLRQHVRREGALEDVSPTSWVQQPTAEMGLSL